MIYIYKKDELIDGDKEKLEELTSSEKVEKLENVQV